MPEQQTPQTEFVPTNYEQPRKTDLWKILWRGKWLIVLAVFIASGLGFLYYLNKAPIYESSARMMITRTHNIVPGIDPLSDYQAIYDRATTLATQSALIRSPVVVGGALKERLKTADESLKELQAKLDEELHGKALDPELVPEQEPSDLNKLSTLADSSNPVSTILGGLSVEPARGNEQVLDLRFRGGDAEDCQLILDAVIASYKSYLRGNRDAQTRQTVGLIIKAKNELEGDIEEREAAYSRFRQENSHLLFKGKEGENVHQDRAWEIESAPSELLFTKSSILADIKYVEKQTKSGVNPRVILASRTENTNDDRGTETRDPLMTLRLEEARLLEDFGSDHPDVISVRKRMKLMQQYLGLDEASDPLDLYLASLQQRLAKLEEEDAQLKELLAKEQEGVKSLQAIEERDEAFISEINRKKDLHDVIIKRLDEVNLSDDMGGYEATVIVPASYGSKVEPSLLRTMALSLFLGLVGGVGLAYLVDFADKRFRSPEDVQHELGFPLIGHIPALRPELTDDSELDPMLCTFHTPRAPPAEAFRAVRTALYFSVRAAGHQVIQVTSPSPGDGKTTLSSNLALAIANSNKRVLLIDADFRRPRVHKVFNVDRRVGLSSVIEGELEVAETLSETPIENLTLMTAGPRTQNPAELLTSPKFEELLALMRDQFDFVIVDTPPLLAVTDASVVAPRADGVLLTLRITKRARANARRASEMLDSVGANVLGVVVNGIVGRQGAYGSRGYGYGYGYGQGYNSAYSYGSEESARYFAEDREGDDELAAVEARPPRNGRGRGNGRR